MGWSPLSQHRGILCIVVGLLLLTNPVVVDATDVGDPDRYRYEAAEITFDEEGVRVPIGVDDVDPDVACFEELPRRRCMLERAVHANGGLTYDGIPGSSLYSEYEFVYVHGEGFFEPVAEERNGTVWYGLCPVPRERAMEDVATDVSRVSPPIRRAIRTGHVRTRDELPGANELVATDDGYYVVHADVLNWRDTERTGPVVFLQWVGGLLGAGLVLRGQRIRVESG